MQRLTLADYQNLAGKQSPITDTELSLTGRVAYCVQTVANNLIYVEDPTLFHRIQIHHAQAEEKDRNS